MLLFLPEILGKCKLDYRQFGFCRNLSCAFLHRLLKKDKAHRMGSSLFMCSVDISNAFDSFVQSQVFLKLFEYGVNTHVVALLFFWYLGSFVKVRLTGDQLSRLIRLIPGLRQGYVWSPILFKISTSRITKTLLEDSASIYTTSACFYMLTTC